jgi:hypothetical protein
MSVAALVALWVTHGLANPYFEPDDVGMTMLTIWPTARATAVAGAMTALADEADAAYFNPAGLAFQTTAKAEITHANWLPGWYPGMYYVSAIGGAPLHLSFLRGRSAYVAGSLTRMSVGEIDVVDEHGNFLGRFEAWRGAAGVCAAASPGAGLGIGVGLKLLKSVHTSDYWIRWSSYGADVGLDVGGNATAVSADIGLSCRANDRISAGLTATNIGPAIHYDPDYGDPYLAALPSMVRMGLSWTPIENRNVQLRVMPELDKLLVSMFSDTTGKSFGRQLNEEWRDVSKALGVEVTAFNLVSLRLGYIEDLGNELGGLIYQREGWYSQGHYGLWDVITRRDLGEFRRIGLCWGIGVGTDRLRFDLSSDAAIYDFPTSNWKFQLTCNDIGGLFGRRTPSLSPRARRI